MNPYQDKVCCSLCGGAGYAWAGTGFQAWLGVPFVHKNPAVCRAYIKAREREMQREIERLRERAGQ